MLLRSVLRRGKGKGVLGTGFCDGAIYCKFYP